MSTAYELVCPVLKKTVWVGQGKTQMDNFFADWPDAMSALHEFLRLTAGQQLVLMKTADVPEDYTTIEHDEEKRLPKKSPIRCEVEDLRNEIASMAKELAAYRNGNTALLEVLMRVYDTAPLSMDLADKTLRNAGMINSEGFLDWKALEARKETPMSWKDAVRKFVRSPSEQRRLLALADEG